MSHSADLSASLSEYRNRFITSPLQLPGLSQNVTDSNHALINMHRKNFIHKKCPYPNNMFSFVFISGNNIALLCSKFRDATISRAITLTDPIRGTSLHDVEANIAFPVGFGGSCLAVNSHGKGPVACVQT